MSGVKHGRRLTPRHLHRVLMAAADEVRTSKQSLKPGGPIRNPSAREMGLIIGDALAKVCSSEGLEFDAVLSAYVKEGVRVGFEWQGSSYAIAARHLAAVAERQAPSSQRHQPKEPAR